MITSRHCLQCKRTLSNLDSMERGYGPICAARMKANSWRGESNPDQHYDIPFDHATMDIVCRRNLGNEHQVHFNIPHAIVKHSPDGMEWGYGGSGPADFAINILRLFLDDAAATDPRLYQEFKAVFVAAIPKEGGVIAGADIKAWIAERQPLIQEILTHNQICFEF